MKFLFAVLITLSIFTHGSNRTLKRNTDWIDSSCAERLRTIASEGWPMIVRDFKDFRTMTHMLSAEGNIVIEVFLTHKFDLLPIATMMAQADPRNLVIAIRLGALVDEKDRNAYFDRLLENIQVLLFFKALKEVRVGNPKIPIIILSTLSETEVYDHLAAYRPEDLP